MTYTPGRFIAQSLGYQINTQPKYHIIRNITPPVPAQIRQKITQDEIIDFAVMLHEVTFLDVATDPLALALQSIKKISSFAMCVDTSLEHISLSNLQLQSHKSPRNDILSHFNLLCQCTFTTTKLVAV